MELLLSFLISPLGVSLIGGMITGLTALSGYLGNKHLKAKRVLDTVIKGIELGGSKETKDVIKSLIVTQKLVHAGNFNDYVKGVTIEMKTKGLDSASKVLTDLDESTTLMTSAKKLYQKL